MRGSAVAPLEVPLLQEVERGDSAVAVAAAVWIVAGVGVQEGAGCKATDGDLLVVGVEGGDGVGICSERPLLLRW